MVLLVDRELDVPEALGADQVVEHGGPLQVEPPLQRLLPALRLPPGLQVEDDVARAPQHVLQHGLDLPKRDTAPLLQDDGHGLEHGDGGDDLGQLDLLLGLAGGSHGVGDVEELEHRGQGALAEGHLGRGGGGGGCWLVALLGDDQPVVRVVVAAREQEVVQVGDGLLDALSLQELQAVDQLQQHEAHVLLELVQAETLPALLQVLGEGAELENLETLESPNHSWGNDKNVSETGNSDEDEDGGDDNGDGEDDECLEVGGEGRQVKV